ncbi:MAG: hypothetical protein AB1431_07155 [Pseudomonadota bacterium]
MSAKKHEAECARLQRTIDQLTEDANLWRSQSYEADLRIEKLEAELANWRANGQLRDPKTGRLIPKGKQKDMA